MIKRIVIAIIYCTVGLVYAQNNNVVSSESSVSPYSFFGVGDIRAGSSVENRSLGGIGIYADSIHLNLRNPAAYSKLALTTYTGAFTQDFIGINSATESQNTSLTNLEYLAIGFSLKKGFGLGFGVAPFSSVGYNLVSEDVNNNQTGVTNVFAGEGGLSRTYVSLGYEVVKNFSVGATANFNFGTIENRRIQSVADVQFGTLDNRESRINGFSFDFSAIYTPKIGKKNTLFTSLIINAQNNLVSENSRELGSFSILNGQEIEIVEVDLDAQGLRNTELKLPVTTNIGLGYGENKKWFFGAEYSFQELSSFTNEFIDVDNFRYEDASTLAFGGFFIPNFSTFSSYLSRVTYRAGARFSSTGLVVNDEEIDDFGITFGLGLPLGAGFSNINVGFEYGQRGTTNANLVEENYFSVKIGISLSDSSWFRRRQIN